MTQLQNGIDTTVPHPARVYDYWLGGKDNFAADRTAGQAGYKAFPGVLQSVQANRAFLGRVVRYLVTQAGVRQFIDIGSGLPTTCNTHEIAQQEDPEARVVYVDIEPMVLLHARVLLQSSPEGRVDFLQADVREPESILEQAADTLDFREPAAVLLLGVLHFLPDDAQVAEVAAAFGASLTPGGYLAVSHAASDIQPEQMAAFARRMGEAGAPPGALRNREQVTALFDGLELVEPGVVPVPSWRPRSEIEAAAPATLWGGVGRRHG